MSQSKKANKKNKNVKQDLLNGAGDEALTATNNNNKKHKKQKNLDVNDINLNVNKQQPQQQRTNSIASDSVSSSENNNNSNNNNADDEVIEEFDFSDTDLKELNDYQSHNENEPPVIEQNDDDDDDAYDSAMEAMEEQHDNKNTTADKQHNIETLNSLDNAVSNAANQTSEMSLRDKRKATPADLDITAATQLINDRSTEVVDAAAQDSYCPMTPRKIIDVDTLPRLTTKAAKLQNSQSQTSMISADAESTATSVTKHTEDDYDDNDDVDDNEPDDELLVQFLGEANRIAEARLAARRQARAEAREIRMRELERQQKEQEQNADRVFDMQNSATASGIDPVARSRLAGGIAAAGASSVLLLNSTRANSISSRRSSEDSLEEEGRSLRDIRHELKDVEERFRKAMIANAQLDNERASQTYQIQLLKDKLEEMEESYAQLQREYKEKSRDCNAFKRNVDKLTEELKLVQGQLNERDQLISDQGLVIVAVENEDGTDARRALVSVENAQLLGSVQGSLDVRLKKFAEEKQQLQAEIQKLQQQLENSKNQGKSRGAMNGPNSVDDEYEAQREANKIISEYKYKLQKAEQEIASLQASLARSETQVIRYKSTAEAAEKAEAELKADRRKLQREHRETMERLEELETSNNHLLKRLDKLKNAKSALLKDL